ncbi:MAG: biopolymer transporter ExbD, partial [Verrucomicrobiae bacterium]|nr:biopolymer transporter ExbD [Verrucomicrobiae bacterium]NNJ86240.1 biopolymer transporter ExbD [Akkermansiaceae bacterium]
RKSLKEAGTPVEPSLDISSLIDVCFLLLIYFLVTTTIQPREQDLQNPVPGFVTPENIPPIPPMCLELREGGELVVNLGAAAEIIDPDVASRQMPNLRSRLDSIVNAGPSGSPRVMLKVHDEVRQQRYVDVLNCLASAGISDIAIQD